MGRKMAWLVVSSLMALSLALVSCAPAPTTPTPTPTAPTPTPTAPTPTTPTPTAPTPAGPEMVKVTLTKLDGTKVEKMQEKPKYGGTLTTYESRTFTNIDPVTGTPAGGIGAAYSSLLDRRDFARGLAGTGEFLYTTGANTAYISPPLMAESYEITDDTITFHLRQGMHYSFDPANEASRLVGGREVTADDVVFVIKRYFNMLTDYPPVPRADGPRRLSKEEQPLTITAPDKYTVVLTVLPGNTGNLFKVVVFRVIIYPPELVAKYGDLSRWEVSFGSAPFIKKDFLPGISDTVVKNPNYWDKSHIYGMQLPFVDSVRTLIIRDRSTLLAGVRTGKIDYLPQLRREEGLALVKSAPGLIGRPVRYRDTLIFNYRVDKPELPTYDIRVRQALQLAVDRQQILNDFYGGDGVIYSFPVTDVPDYHTIGAFKPFDELPANVQELFQYKPDKAKQLLTEAGYPNGFTLEVTTQADWVDPLLILKDYYEKVGVILNLKVVESGTYNSIVAGGAHEATFMEKRGPGSPHNLDEIRVGNYDDTGNHSRINDPKANTYILEFGKYFFRDDAKAFQLMREFTPYFLEQAWLFQFPVGDGYGVWWPWVKDYYGEPASSGNAVDYWVDQELKKSMGY